MRTHIMLALMALIISACASKREIASTQDEGKYGEQTHHAQMIDSAASARGNSVR